MKIRIKKYITEFLVEFSTTTGKGIGVITEKKNLDEEWNVELDINQTLEFDKDVIKIHENVFSIKHLEKYNRIQGLVEAIDSDGLVCLRLSIDCLILIEIKKVNFKQGDYLQLDVDFNSFLITPF